MPSRTGIPNKLTSARTHGYPFKIASKVDFEPNSIIIKMLFFLQHRLSLNVPVLVPNNYTVVLMLYCWSVKFFIWSRLV